MPNPIEIKMKQRLKKIKVIVFDFDGVFTDNSVYVDQNGQESVRCSKSDGPGLRRLDQIGVSYLILSAEKNPVVSARGRKLGIEVLQGHEDKLSILTDLVRTRKLAFEEVAYVGNDLNDIGCLEAVGFPIAVSDAFPEVVHAASFVTSRAGGHGAVREVCDLLYKSFI